MENSQKHAELVVNTRLTPVQFYQTSTSSNSAHQSRKSSHQAQSKLVSPPVPGYKIMKITPSSNESAENSSRIQEGESQNTLLSAFKGSKSASPVKKKVLLSPTKQIVVINNLKNKQQQISPLLQYCKNGDISNFKQSVPLQSRGSENSINAKYVAVQNHQYSHSNRQSGQKLSQFSHPLVRDEELKSERETIDIFDEAMIDPTVSESSFNSLLDLASHLKKTLAKHNSRRTQNYSMGSIKEQIELEDQSNKSPLLNKHHAGYTSSSSSSESQESISCPSSGSGRCRFFDSSQNQSKHRSDLSVSKSVNLSGRIMDRVNLNLNPLQTKRHHCSLHCPKHAELKSSTHIKQEQVIMSEQESPLYCSDSPDSFKCPDGQECNSKKESCAKEILRVFISSRSLKIDFQPEDEAASMIQENYPSQSNHTNSPKIVLKDRQKYQQNGYILKNHQPDQDQIILGQTKRGELNDITPKSKLSLDISQIVQVSQKKDPRLVHKSSIVESERIYQHDFCSSDVRKDFNNQQFGPASPLSSTSRFGQLFQGNFQSQR